MRECKAQRRRHVHENGEVFRNSKFGLNEMSIKQIYQMCAFMNGSYFLLIN